jgi:DNA polymerase III delta prime subunit
MHAYLLISKDQDCIQKKVSEIAQSHNALVTPFDLQKIADVRELQTVTKLALSSPIVFFIQNVHTATSDALNAFLKQLEEPGKNVFYILSASSEDKVLPTIVSRCQVIRIMNYELRIKEEHDKNNLFTEPIGIQLQILDKIKKRDEAIEFLQSLIENLHRDLTQNKSSDLSLITSYLSHAQHALTALEKNGNVTIQLARFIVATTRDPMYNRIRQ